MLKDYHRSWLEIDYHAIQHNVQEVQKLVGSTKIMGIVKADAYGHGLVECTQALRDCGVDYFGVACLDEAIQLREAGIDANILILGYTHPDQFVYLVTYNLVQSLCSYEFAQALNQFARKMRTKVRAHLKLDTGMNRTGMLYQDAVKEFAQVKDCYRMEHLLVEGIFSHFPVSDDLQQEATSFTQHQIELFNECVNKLRDEGIDVGLRHIQNSYGILNYQDLGMDYCRPGLLYMGVTSDSSIAIKSQPDFIPILRWKANVSVVKTIQAGMSVSYGRHFIAQKPTKIATLSVGYADGLPRALSNLGIQVLVHGRACPIVGNICMDQCMVDVSAVKSVHQGDEVTIVGPGMPVDRLSQALHTINNETLCRLAARLPRLQDRGMNDEESVSNH